MKPISRSRVPASGDRKRRPIDLHEMDATSGRSGAPLQVSPIPQSERKTRNARQRARPEHEECVTHLALNVDLLRVPEQTLLRVTLNEEPVLQHTSHEPVDVYWGWRRRHSWQLRNGQKDHCEQRLKHSPQSTRPTLADLSGRALGPDTTRRIYRDAADLSTCAVRRERSRRETCSRGGRGQPRIAGDAPRLIRPMVRAPRGLFAEY
jgi:hypothetical protein